MKILLTRHGQDDPLYRGGWSQRGLIDEGVKQSKLLGQCLTEKWLPIDKIISSDLSRAKETTSNILSSLNRPVKYYSTWREMNNGDLAGLLNETAENKYPNLFFRTLYYNDKYPNGESPHDFFERVIKAFKKLLTGKHENILVVTHGGVISIIIYYIKTIKWSNKLPIVPCKPTGLYEIHYDGNNCKIITENYYDHLGHDYSAKKQLTKAVACNAYIKLRTVTHYCCTIDIRYPVLRNGGQKVPHPCGNFKRGALEN